MSSIYTYEQVKDEFKNCGLELISTEYNSAEQKLQYICPKHRDKGIQEIDFRHLHYRNQGCKYCGREKAIEGRTILENIVKAKAESLGWEYVGRKTSGTSGGKTLVQVICPNHREKGIQNVFWSSINIGRGCKYCAMNVQLTTEEYIKRISDKLPHIEILSQYVSQKIRVTAHCKIHDVTWDVLPYDLLRDTACGCEKCSKLALREYHLKSFEERVEELSKINPTIELLPSEVETGSLTMFRCKVCGNTWATIYGRSYFSGRNSCPECTKKQKIINQTKTDSKFREEVKERLPHIELLSTYINAKIPVKLYCTKHDYTYYSMPQSILNNKNGCPKCSPKYCENLVSKYLDDKSILHIREYRFADCVDKRTLPFDYFLPDYNVIIEYDGEDHFIPINRNKRGIQASLDKLKYTQNHDSIKTNYCLKNNIPLIRIPYWEKENMVNFLDEKLIPLLDSKGA